MAWGSRRWRGDGQSHCAQASPIRHKTILVSYARCGWAADNWAWMSRDVLEVYVKGIVEQEAGTEAASIPPRRRHTIPVHRSGPRAAQACDLGLDASLRAVLPDYPGEGKIQEAPKRRQISGAREQDPKSISRDEHAARHVPRGGVPRGRRVIFESFITQR